MSVTNSLHFIEELTEALELFLNSDEGFKRRLKPFPVFMGGPVPYPGPGPYPPPNLVYDPSGWSESKGYNTSRLPGRELVEISVPDFFVLTVGLRKNLDFYVELRKAEKPCLRVEMPFEVFKDMALGKEKVVWSLADEKNKVEYERGIGFSDWITILGVIGKIQELMEFDPDLRGFLENLNWNVSGGM